MFVAETAMAVTMLCSSAKKRQRGDDPGWFSVSTSKCSSCVVSSGRTLERKMTDDIEALAGVLDVSLNRIGDSFSFTIVMQDMDYARFDRVVQKELEWSSAYPGFSFYFDIMSAAELEESSIVDAA